MEKITKNRIIKKIKEKKELSGISDLFIEEELNNYELKERLDFSKLKDKELKLVIKQIRAKLRKLHGQFKKTKKNRLKILEGGSISDLLSSHSSTAERLENYDLIKDLILSLKIKSILDLGCGLNPIALAPLISNVRYYASDINEEDLLIVKKFFKKNKINGKTFFYDIRKMNSNLPKIDICILFKVLDILEPPSKNRGALTKKILDNLKCNYILISFSTKKISGKKMNHPKRRWFERVLSDKRIKFKEFLTENEIFYLLQMG